MDAPTAPDVGERLAILGVGSTVKLAPLLFTPLALTTTFPVVAPEGTVTTMLPADQLVTVAVVPLNLTVLVPCEAPKFAPAIVTDVPRAAAFGVTVEMLGAATTVNGEPLLGLPDTATTTFPVVAVAGTTATMLVALQLVVLAVMPLNLTVLVPLVDPNAVPMMVTDAPTAADVGDTLEIVGAPIASEGRERRTNRESAQHAIDTDGAAKRHPRGMLDSRSTTNREKTEAKTGFMRDLACTTCRMNLFG